MVFFSHVKCRSHVIIRFMKNSVSFCFVITVCWGWHGGENVCTDEVYRNVLNWENRNGHELVIC